MLKFSNKSICNIIGLCRVWMDSGHWVYVLLSNFGKIRPETDAIWLSSFKISSIIFLSYLPISSQAIELVCLEKTSLMRNFNFFHSRAQLKSGSNFKLVIMSTIITSASLKLLLENIRLRNEKP